MTFRRHSPGPHGRNTTCREHVVPTGDSHRSHVSPEVFGNVFLEDGPQNIFGPFGSDQPINLNSSIQIFKSPSPLHRYVGNRLILLVLKNLALGGGGRIL